MSARYVTEPMAVGDGDCGFRSGVHALDDYFARHAAGNSLQGIGKTFVLRGKGDGLSILGFYTLSMAEVRADIVSALMHSRLPKYPLPVALIGRFAVATAAQGRGVGGRLLADACYVHPCARIGG